MIQRKPQVLYPNYLMKIQLLFVLFPCDFPPFFVGLPTGVRLPAAASEWLATIGAGGEPSSWPEHVQAVSWNSTTAVKWKRMLTMAMPYSHAENIENAVLYIHRQKIVKTLIANLTVNEKKFTKYQK
jgi:hypothetical protein